MAITIAIFGNGDREVDRLWLPIGLSLLLEPNYQAIISKLDLFVT